MRAHAHMHISNLVTIRDMYLKNLEKYFQIIQQNKKTQPPTVDGHNHPSKDDWQESDLNLLAVQLQASIQ